jgi:hypothetical protein
MTIQDIQNKIFNDANKAIKVNRSNDKLTMNQRFEIKQLLTNPLTEEIYTYGMTNGLIGSILRNSQPVKDALNEVSRELVSIHPNNPLLFKPRNQHIELDHMRHHVVDEARPQVINDWWDPVNYVKPEYKRRSKFVHRNNILSNI